MSDYTLARASLKMKVYARFWYTQARGTRYKPISDQPLRLSIPRLLPCGSVARVQAFSSLRVNIVHDDCYESPLTRRLVRMGGVGYNRVSGRRSGQTGFVYCACCYLQFGTTVMDTFTLQLTTIAHGGAALGRHEGRVIFVPYTLPGETTRVEIIEDKGRYAIARLVEVLEPSHDRVSPPCPYFGPTGCGGCQWQHVGYQAQLRFKAEIVADQLTRIGKIAAPTVHPTRPDSSGWAYRNHAQLHPVPGGGLGFRAASGDDVIPIEECPILHPLLSDLYAALDLDFEGLLRLSLRAGTTSGDQMLIFEMEGDLPPALEIDLPVSCVLLLSNGQHANLIGHNYITETVAGRTYRISAPSFFQVNTPQAGQLVRLGLDYLDLQGGETVLDGYCGVGLFTTHLAQRAGLVIGIESSPAAVTDLLENISEFDNVEVVEGPVEAVLPDLDTRFDAAVVDPPRVGVDRFALDALIERRPARLVYVSCDPATLARDAQRLTRSGYRLVKVQPVDMFPQTYHIESVALFVWGE
ncbi:MAG: 23S rRNA (uracil(1939)-C(5))-methyltransferase RlmD [Chloroflexi bacterium]|nr:MAG: 23S rRNA (uracil(1939)-C(5))-methyltransferase RlmD [Chloroflexota bacterium]RLC86579.1 MAG: 23S rRNA (uracil(1939)-C(5))-methyltransferase RlmD [Chloroflexota bacterium]